VLRRQAPQWNRQRGVGAGQWPFGEDGGMPNWRHSTAPDPDGPDEWRFQPLVEHDHDLSLRLTDIYAHRWVERSGFPPERTPEVPDTIELVVADEWAEASIGMRRLRLTSSFTGNSYYLPDWDGGWYEAKAWIEDVAEMQAGGVDDYRGRYGPTPWDDPESQAWKQRAARWEAKDEEEPAG